MTEIFQEIWDADQSANGVPALRPGDEKDESRGYVVVDESATAVGSGHHVLKEVLIPENKRQTYLLCERLFDNYALERAARERVRPGETQEELEFIDAIVASPPVETARQYLESSLDLTISGNALAAMIKETWFTMGRSGNQPDASGFEHVFVGEQGSSATQIGGYHFWYKYWLDDAGRHAAGETADDKIEYLGTKYSGAESPGKGVLVPEVVTLEMTWQAPIGDASSPDPTAFKTLHKPIGGFFVGLSPECMVALGLVRTRTQSSKRTRINGAEYQLDLHRLDGNRNAIRTFFPRFIKADVIDIDTGGGSEGGVTPGDGDISAPFRIVAAMVNPVNPEGGREFLQIINASNQARTLLNWEIAAPNGTVFTMADIALAPGEVFKFVIPSAGGILRNKAGVIQLHAPGNELVQECAYTTDQARREGYPIVF